MENVEVKAILEGLIFVSPSPVKLETLLEVLPESGKEDILEELRRIKEEYDDSSKGLELVEVAGGYQFRTKPRWAEWVARLKKAKTVKFSQSALETLAIVAYRQPVIRPQIEEIRGVDSGWILRNLLEKGLIKILGRKDLPGRPIIYGTTKAFLELFNLNSLSDLPSLREIQPPPPLGENQKPGVSEGAEGETAVEVKAEGEETIGEPTGGEPEARDEANPETEERGEVEVKAEENSTPEAEAEGSTLLEPPSGKDLEV